MRRRSTALASIALLGAVMAACGAGGGHKAAVGQRARSGPSSSAATVSIPAAALADPGLPSQVGPGPLSTPVATQLMQYFEDRVAQAYATNDADSLYRYLAGPMLTGNRGTINAFVARHRRNVLHLVVDNVTIDTADKTRTVLDMNGHLTDNRFFDTTTGQPLLGGASQNGPVGFQVFLDYNPGNHTWYWTGEQDLGNAGGSAGSPDSGQASR
ncbi:MAG: hypothetical protein JO148_12265 [Acidimicrobiia bacterium]|nr:hypothetical protein [Acidimicrobiia bacterium]